MKLVKSENDRDKDYWPWGTAWHRGSKLASHPAAPGSQHSRFFFSGKIIDVAEVDQLPWLEESGQWLKNVDRTHLVLARGKTVLQKRLLANCFFWRKYREFRK